MRHVYVTGHTVLAGIVIVQQSDGSMRLYDAIKLGCEWFRMTNDCFYDTYGFNFNPHKWGLYEQCRQIVHDEKSLY